MNKNDLSKDVRFLMFLLAGLVLVGGEHILLVAYRGGTFEKVVYYPIGTILVLYGLVRIIPVILEDIRSFRNRRKNVSTTRHFEGGD